MRTARPARPARIDPAAALTPRIDARVRCSRPIDAGVAPEIRRQPVFATVGGQIGQAGEVARKFRVQVRPGSDQPFRRPAGAATGRQGDGEPTQREEYERDETQDGGDRAEDHAREGDRQDRRSGRHDPAHEERVERVDIGHRSGQQVATPERAKPTRRERLDRPEEPDADLRQDPEGGEMRNVPLGVAEGRSGDRERADRRDGDREGREPCHQRGLRDEVRRGRQQCDVGGERAEAREHRQEHPPADRRGERQQPPERRRAAHGRRALGRPVHG